MRRKIERNNELIRQSRLYKTRLWSAGWAGFELSVGFVSSETNFVNSVSGHHWIQTFLAVTT